jgi:hypothetical protein
MPPSHNAPSGLSHTSAVPLQAKAPGQPSSSTHGSPGACASTAQPMHALSAGATHATAFLPLHAYAPAQPSAPVQGSLGACASTEQPMHALSAGASHASASMPLQAYVPVQPSAAVHAPSRVPVSAVHPPQSFFPTQAFPTQHPVGHDAASHTQAPFAHPVPAAHVWHASPPTPQVALLDVSHWPLLQHPSGHDVPSQMHLPVVTLHRSPVPHAAHAAPPAPQDAAPWAA